MLWNNGGDGSFFDSANWNPNTVADSEQLAIFAADTNTGSTVSFGSSGALIERLRVEKGGFLRFDGGRYETAAGSVNAPSLVFEPSGAAQAMFFQLQGGHQLQTRHALLRAIGIEIAENFSGNGGRCQLNR